MAWNPTPEVAVARDSAKRLGDLAGHQVTRCVVVYELDDGRIGYASYGATKNLCNSARAWADEMLQWSEDIPE